MERPLERGSVSSPFALLSLSNESLVISKGRCNNAQGSRCACTGASEYDLTTERNDFKTSCSSLRLGRGRLNRCESHLPFLVTLGSHLVLSHIICCSCILASFQISKHSLFFPGSPVTRVEHQREIGALPVLDSCGCVEKP